MYTYGFLIKYPNAIDKSFNFTFPYIAKAEIYSRSFLKDEIWAFISDSIYRLNTFKIQVQNSSVRSPEYF